MRTPWLLSPAVVLAALAGAGCEVDPALLLPGRLSPDVDLEGLTLVARVVHVTDTHLIDEESPARFAGAHVLTDSAWRPQEAYSTQLFDGILRTVNRIHASGREIDFLIHTGDACDNVQANELAWFVGALEGELIDPLTGPDDRPPAERPEPALDPHASFQAHGLYRTGVHGDLASIPWYVLFGNHDVCAIGVFPISEWPDGRRTAPLPLTNRPGLVLPVRLDPLGSSAYGNVTPGDPGPPCLFETPRYVQPNPQRAYFCKSEFIAAVFETVTEPAGHGFADPVNGPSWYSVSPVAGLRLIGLDTTDHTVRVPALLYQEGALSEAQLAFLRSELDAATDRGEIVIVASHHPSSSLVPGIGVEVVGRELRAVLSECPNVVLHLAGHHHRNHAIDRGGYVEIETCSTLDPPQEGRLIEIWRDDADGSVLITYEMFSHLDDSLPPLGEDPLRLLRETAQAIALGDKGAAARQKRFDPTGADPYGEPADRRGYFMLPR